MQESMAESSSLVAKIELNVGGIFAEVEEPSSSLVVKKTQPIVDDSLTKEEFDAWWEVESDYREFTADDVSNAADSGAYDGRLDIICYLQRTYGIDWTSEDSPIKDVIYGAIRTGSLQLLRYLHTIQGIDFSKHRESYFYGKDVLELVAERGHLEILRWFRDVVGLEVIDKQKLLDSAVGMGYLSLAKYAVAIGASVKAISSKSGQTLAHTVAAGSGKCDSLKRRVNASSKRAEELYQAAYKIDPREERQEEEEYEDEEDSEYDDESYEETEEDCNDEYGEEDSEYDDESHEETEEVCNDEYGEESEDDDSENPATYAPRNKPLVLPERAQNHMEVLQWLKEQKLDLNAKQNDGATALHLAAKSGHLEMMKWLLAQGANVFAKTIDGRSVAHFAVHSFDMAVLEWLDATYQWNFARDRTLHDSTLAHAAAVACTPDLLDKLKFLHARGVDMRARRQAKESPTVLTIAPLDPSIFKWLHTDCGVDVGALCTTHQSANALLGDNGPAPPLLYSAIAEGKETLVKWLHSVGANLNAKMNGYTAAAVAAKHGQLEILKWLHLLGYDVIGVCERTDVPFVKDILGYVQYRQPPLHCLPHPFLAATNFYSTRIVEWYVDTLGMDVNTMDTRTSASFVAVAASSSNVSLLDWLLERGVDTEHFPILPLQDPHAKRTKQNVPLFFLASSTATSYCVLDWLRQHHNQTGDYRTLFLALLSAVDNQSIASLYWLEEHGVWKDMNLATSMLRLPDWKERRSVLDEILPWNWRKADWVPTRETHQTSLRTMLADKKNARRKR